MGLRILGNDWVEFWEFCKNFELVFLISQVFIQKVTFRASSTSEPQAPHHRHSTKKPPKSHHVQSSQLVTNPKSTATSSQPSGLFRRQCWRSGNWSYSYGVVC